jgi:signal transduction histidine kinase
MAASAVETVRREWMAVENRRMPKTGPWPATATTTAPAPTPRRRWLHDVPRRGVAWLAAATLVALLGATAIVRWDIATRREAFAVDARIAHRLLSQRAAQLDAVLATLALLAPAADIEEPAVRLPALWPAVLSVQRSDAQHPWPDAALAAAEAQSRALAAGQRHAVLAAVDPARAHYSLVLAGNPASWALRVDARRLVPADEWPLSDAGPVRALLVAGAHALVLHPGAPEAGQPAGLTPGFTFAKVLATPSQPFELRLQRATGPAQWPWGWLLAWAAACAAAAAVLWALKGARDTQRRNAELVRMAQAARLNTLGELAAGMAHELNQPLAAVLASTQAAQRLLRQDEQAAPQELGDDGPDLPAVRQALGLAAAQARRASDVLTRLRRLVQDPTQGAVRQEVDLQALCVQMLRLLGPELQRRGISASVSGSVPLLWADPVMLEQIVHNLVTNAMQALEGAATPSPTISVMLQPAADQAHALLLVRDNGPGFAPEHLARVFEPFFSTRAGGLGLGLPLCETLAQALGGNLQARNLGAQRAGSTGAELVLTLPLAGSAPVARAAR